MSTQLLTGLTSYNLDRAGQVDKSEKWGTYLFRPIQWIAGTEYKVMSSKKFKEQDKPSLPARIATLIVSLLLSPFIAVTTIVGYGLLKYSTSYQTCLSNHQKVIDKAATKALTQNPPATQNPPDVINEDANKEIHLTAEQLEYFRSKQKQKAKESGYARDYFGLEKLIIFKMAQEALSVDSIQAIMEGAIESDEPLKVIAVIVAILKQVKEGVKGRDNVKVIIDGQPVPANDPKLTMDRLNKVKTFLSADPKLLEKAILDQEAVKGDEARLQLKFIENQQLNLILEYKDTLELPQSIVTKIESTLAHVKQLKEQIKDEPVIEIQV